MRLFSKKTFKDLVNSILSPEQVELKELKIKEINDLQKKYKDIYEEFYKDQKPKRGRKPKTKA